MNEFEELTFKVLSLPTENRAKLAELLIQSIDEKEAIEVKNAWLKEIQKRDAAIRTGEIVTEPAEEVFKKARNSLKCIK